MFGMFYTSIYFIIPVLSLTVSKWNLLKVQKYNNHHRILLIKMYQYKRRRQWHPTPVLLPGKSHGWRSLVGCSPRGRGRVGHNWATSLSLFAFMHWRRKWQPTPLFLPGESQGRQSLVGCCLRVAQSQTRLMWLSSSTNIKKYQNQTSPELWI